MVSNAVTVDVTKVVILMNAASVQNVTVVTTQV